MLKPKDQRDPVLQLVQRAPIYSKTWTAYVLTLIALGFAIRMQAPPEAIGTLAQAILFGLMVLLGGTKAVEYVTHPEAIKAMAKPAQLPFARDSHPPQQRIGPNEQTPVVRPPEPQQQEQG